MPWVIEAAEEKASRMLSVDARLYYSKSGHWGGPEHAMEFDDWHVANRKYHDLKESGDLWRQGFGVRVVEKPM